MRLALDHHYSPVIAAQLRAKGHDAVAALEMGWEAEEDESLFALCEAESRTLLTNNVADFAVIVRTWAAAGRSHHGVVYTSDASLPRGRNTIGRYVELLDALLTAHPGNGDFVDRVHWL